MKFVLTAKHEYWWPVKVAVPDPEKPGAFAEQTFEGRFRWLPAEERQAHDAAIAGAATAEASLAAQDALLKAAMIGWRDVVDEDGTELQPTAENVTLALSQGWFRAGVMRALIASLSGDAARLGN